MRSWVVLSPNYHGSLCRPNDTLPAVTTSFTLSSLHICIYSFAAGIHMLQKRLLLVRSARHLQRLRKPLASVIHRSLKAPSPKSAMPPTERISPETSSHVLRKIMVRWSLASVDSCIYRQVQSLSHFARMLNRYLHLQLGSSPYRSGHCVTRHDTAGS